MMPSKVNQLIKELNEIESLNSALKTYKYHVNNLINQNTKLIKENKKLKEQLKNK